MNDAEYNDAIDNAIQVVSSFIGEAYTEEEVAKIVDCLRTIRRDRVRNATHSTT